ncbi:cobaltochelatase subunit CobN [Paracoccus onubensis]|uniref:cobaltochelatase subunit CobN n=1 Tax=Paracoccus onubensis TaxID=1675788 RepID=UPI00272F0781|nr:cobaltochelatase subunit CobN [Paracoccus onubensis]MDP0928664.1 cobaltochelatase subunit CobN [Paracoccus onubensis]
MSRLLHAALLALLLFPLAGMAGTARGPVLRILAPDFIVPGKFQALEEIARSEGVELQSVIVGPTHSGSAEWLADADLILIDTSRPNDRAQLEAVLANLPDIGVPRITIGGGAPQWQHLASPDATRLIEYYGAGGTENYRNFFRYLAAWSRDADRSGFPDPVALPETAIYHPDAPDLFTGVTAYLDWQRGRGLDGKGVIGIVTHSGTVTDLTSGPVDGLIRGVENSGLIPVAFWSPSEARPKLLRQAGADAVVIRTHLRDGPVLAQQFLELDIPVIQTLVYRDGSAKDFRAAQSGVAQGSAAVFLAGAEVWGASDPIVLTAIENGQEVLIPEQLDALTDKLSRLVVLRHKPEDEKRLAMMFWNYPPGERNYSASNLNIPRSIEMITGALADAGYHVDPLDEAGAIGNLQALLSMLWRTTPPEALLDRGLADTLPVSDYRAWLDGLPDIRHKEMTGAGDPSRHWAVRQIDGQAAFVIPRLQLGNLVILPQMPRDGDGGHSHYHDTASAPDHLYMAAYLWLRQEFGADALIHLGTHGTQEWLKGKDRGLWAGDYPYLALGDMPVFYPYLQDNVSEAIQARRRGRAVIVSHQTPPFAPAGLQEELRELHHLIHEYDQLAPGPVRDESATRLRKMAAESGLSADMGWNEAKMQNDFSGFMSALHDHLHHLAESAVPLGLHVFGEPADPEHRLVTIMKQLGEPFQNAFGDGDEPLVEDPALIGQSAPVVQLRRWLRDGEEATTPEMTELRDRAMKLDQAAAASDEIPSLLAGLAGRYIPPGSGGDPIRDPELRSGRNLYAFEADRIPSESAYAAGERALDQLLTAYAEDHDGEIPDRLAFSLWASEAINHLGVTEAQILHALGLHPIRDPAGRLTDLEIIPSEELGRPRIDVVISVTSVYRDQFDSFMRLLAQATDRLAELDEPGNAVALNSRRIEAELSREGIAQDQAARLARYRIFSNAPENYGSGISHVTLDSASWDDEAVPAETFLNGTRFAYGAEEWGIAPDGVNLFARQLSGSDAAIMSRSSNLHGVLSSDHPFEFLGGLGLAIRHLDGKTPALYISDLRQGEPRTASLSSFLSDELRLRYLSPQWLSAMQEQGYSGTLAVLDGTNNLFGWQVVAPESVRADQWQAMFETYVEDALELGVNEWFEEHNPTAQAQLIARMSEAIRKDYWDAPAETRARMAQRWQELVAMDEVSVHEAAATQDFLSQMAQGYGVDAAPADAAAAEASLTMTDPAAADTAAEAMNESQQVQGKLLAPVPPPPQPAPVTIDLLLGLFGILVLIGFGVFLQIRANRAPSTGVPA